MIIKINNNKFKVKTVITPKDTESGMMGKKFDSSYNGMLFLMDDGEHCFWMKNCIIPLDIIFIDSNTITKIHYNCSPCTTDECELIQNQPLNIPEYLFSEVEQFAIKELTMMAQLPVDPTDDSQNILR